MNTPTQERITLLAEACQSDDSISLLGKTCADDLERWISAELGRPDALDRFAAHGPLLSKAYAPEQLLHIVSGNTPHAAVQSVLRGLLLGSNNTVKIPSVGLPALEEWIANLPKNLRTLVECHYELTEKHWHRASAVIAIGSDITMSEIKDKLQAQQTLIPHGHKISIGIVFDDFKTAARLAAKDCSLFNQRGCLSPHAIYVQGDARQFAEMLAAEMEKFTKNTPPEPLSLSEAGAVNNLRETTRFIAANDDTTKLWESSSNLAWTVIFETSSELKPSCLNRCVYVKELPKIISTGALGPDSQYLSTIALHPFSPESAEKLTALPAHRICPLGKSQEPDLFWHHDGIAPLASLVRWKDLG